MGKFYCRDEVEPCRVAAAQQAGFWGGAARHVSQEEAFEETARGRRQRRVSAREEFAAASVCGGSARLFTRVVGDAASSGQAASLHQGGTGREQGARGGAAALAAGKARSGAKGAPGGAGSGRDAGPAGRGQ